MLPQLINRNSKKTYKSISKKLTQTIILKLPNRNEGFKRTEEGAKGKNEQTNLIADDEMKQQNERGKMVTECGSQPLSMIAAAERRTDGIDGSVLKEDVGNQ